MRRGVPPDSSAPQTCQHPRNEGITDINTNHEHGTVLLSSPFTWEQQFGGSQPSLSQVGDRSAGRFEVVLHEGIQCLEYALQSPLRYPRTRVPLSGILDDPLFFPDFFCAGRVCMFDARIRVFPARPAAMTSQVPLSFAVQSATTTSAPTAKARRRSAQLSSLDPLGNGRSCAQHISCPRAYTM
ncbi:unnamed protein product [Symbiodinium sp. CCMP2592]|nr:unnamed protein product [Symbiodinium sp. CCMP2592]